MAIRRATAAKIEQLRKALKILSDLLDKPMPEQAEWYDAACEQIDFIAQFRSVRDETEWGLMSKKQPF